MNPAEPANISGDPTVGILRTADSMRTEDDALDTATMTAPPRAARGREGERLFVLLTLAGSASAHPYRELLEVVTRRYWATSGSTTAALRVAATAASQHLFQLNLSSSASNRSYGGLTCVVQRGSELFILQAGSGHACVLHNGVLSFFPDHEESPNIGMAPLPEVLLNHALVTTGDTLLLTSAELVGVAGREAISRVLATPGLQELLAGLEQVGAGARHSALVARWTQRREESEEGGSPKSRVPSRRDRRAARREPRRPETPPRPTQPPGPSLGDRMIESLRLGGRGLAYLGHGIAAIAVWVADTVRILARRMLPGAEKVTRRRVRRQRPIPKENAGVLIAVAAGIPILLAIVVTLTYFRFGSAARAQNLIDQSEAEMEAARTVGSHSEDARLHWEAALEHLDAAAKLDPDGPVIMAWKEEALAALDSMDGIIHLDPVELWNIGRGPLPRQLVLRRQMMFILDPSDGWVTRLTVDATGETVVDEDPTFVHTTQQIGGQPVGSLVDLIWVDAGGERPSGGLVILEEGGALLTLDPSWESDSGTPDLERSLLGTPPAGEPRALGSFEGRLYILHDEQIERYEPRGHTYPDPPSRYFVSPPPKSLETALDMAIDGYVYILYEDGTILKFLRGESEPFDVQGLQGDLRQATALAIDPVGDSGALYVADSGNKRVVVLGPDGLFQRQFRAEGAFDGIEALAANEATSRLHVMSNGTLYVATMPQ